MKNASSWFHTVWFVDQASERGGRSSGDRTAVPTLWRMAATAVLFFGSAFLWAQVETQIVEPTSNQVVTLGNSVTFSASATSSDSADSFLFDWTLRTLEGGVVQRAEGSRVTITFTTLGSFVMSCVASTEGGESDRTPATVGVVVIAENNPVETTITSPSGTVTVEVGDSVSFRASASGGDGEYGYAWAANGAGVTPSQATGSSVSFTFESPGEVTISCAARDGSGVVDTTPASRRVIVAQPQLDPVETSIVSPTGSPTVTAGENLSFRAAANGGDGNYSFDWSASGAGVSPTSAEGQTVGFSFNEPGTVTVFCSAKDGSGLADETPASINVRIEAAVAPVETTIDGSNGTPTVAEGGSLTFRASASGGDGEYQFEWVAQGEGVTPSQAQGSSASFTFNQAGTVQIACRARDGSGAVDETPAVIGVRVEAAQVDPVKTEITAPAAGSVFSAGASVTFRAAGDGGAGEPYSYAWILTGGTLSENYSGQSVTVTLDQPGSYSMRCSARDAEGQADQEGAAVNFTVEAPATVDTTILGEIPNNLEVGQTLQLSAAASGGQSPYSFRWTVETGAGSQSFQSDRVVLPLAVAGNYRVSCVAEDSEGVVDQSPAVVSFTVNETQDDPVETVLTPSGGLEANQGDSMVFTAGASGGSGAGYTYSWAVSAPNATVTREGERIELVFDAPGTWRIGVVATDGEGNRDASPATAQVTVIGDADPVITSIEPAGALQAELGDSLSFTAKAEGGSGSGYRFSWDVTSPFNTRSFSGETIGLELTAEGVWTIRCVATDGEGNADPNGASVQVTVGGTQNEPVETAIVAPQGPVETSPGSVVTFRAEGSGGSGSPYRLLWQVSGPADLPTREGPEVSYQFEEPGDYVVRCVAQDSSGVADTSPAEVAVRVAGDNTGDELQTTITGPTQTTFNVGERTRFSAAASGGAGEPYTFAWLLVSEGGEERFSGEAFDYLFNEPGAYVVTCVAADADGASDTTPARLSLRVQETQTDAVDTQIIEPDGPVRIAQGESVTFSAEGAGGVGGPYEFSWILQGNGLSGSVREGNPVTFRFEEPGTFILAVSARDADGNRDESPATTSITVEGEVPGVETEIVRPGPNVTATLGSSVLFEAAGSGGDGGSYSFQWRVLDGSQRTIDELRGNPVPIDFPAAGLYVVAVTATDGSGNQDPTPASALVTVEETNRDELITTIVQPLEDLTLPLGERVELAAKAEGGAGAPYRYEWLVRTPSGGTATESGERIGLTLEESGTYSFTCTAFDSENNAGQPAGRRISVGDGATELDTRIVIPSEGTVTTRVGEMVTFQAESEGGDSTGRVFFDWRLTDASGADVGRFSGPTVYVTPTAPGTFRLEVAARGGDGSRDETPASRTLIVEEGRQELNTLIVEPSADFETEVGSRHRFVADHEGGEGAVRYLWLVTRNGTANVADTYEGQEIQLVFEAPGDYSILCQAVDEKGDMDLSPASRRVRVGDPNDSGDATIEIVEPAADVTVSPGASVTFLAAAAGDTAVEGFKWELIETTTGMTLRRFSGARISVDFPVAGRFSLVCEGITANGVVTPAVSRGVTVDEDEPGETLRIRIVSPENNVRVETGAVVTFRAEVSGGEGSVVWERIQAGADTNTQNQTGTEAQWTFDQAGFYEVVALVLDSTGEVQDGDARRVEVRGLDVRITSPSQREIRLRVGESQTFTGEVTAGGTQQEPYWYFGDNAQDRSYGDTYAASFEDPGTYQLFFEMQSAGGETATDFRWIEVEGEEPLDVAILSPAGNSVFAVNEQFDLVAEVSGAGDDMLETVWVVNGETFSGGNRVEDVSIERPGNYTVEFEVYRPRDDVFRSDTIQINIFDPERALVAEIVEPFTDLQLQVGDSVYFEGVTNGATLGEPLTERWEIVNLADGSQVAGGPRLGNTLFAEAGSFEVRFSAKTATNQSNVATRRIDVGNFDNTAFSENDAPERAVGVRPGRYAEIALDRAHYFSVTLTGDVQNLQVDTGINGTADVTVYGQDALNQLTALRSLRVSGDRGFTVADLAPGTYVIEFVPVAGSKVNLSFGFAVSVLTPSLYFADVNETNSVATQIGVVNPGSSSAVVELVGYDAVGNIVAEATREIVANGKLSGDAKAFFGDEAEGINWVVAQSTKNLQGYSRTESRDGQEAYATSAATKLSSELYVPHIAQKTNNWFTRADVINGGAKATSSQIQAAGGNMAALDVASSFTKDRFRFSEKWEGALPSGAVWARLKETSEQITLAGTEVFGRVDGIRHVAGLSLADAERDNPNFTYVRQNLYFTHIARDTGQFWTGIALVNIDSVSAGMVVRGYGPDGQLVGEKTLTLASEEKIVELAEQFLDGIGSPANVDWVEVETDSGIVGYELFGTHDGSRLAGFEASTSLRTSLCFPVVESGNRWQGISVINVNSSAVTLTFNLYSASGDVLATRTINAAGKQKVLATVRDLFQLEAVPANGGWVGLTATAPVAGFELFGNSGGTQMSALKAQ